MSAGPVRPVTVRCPFCGRLNRVDLARLADAPRCGVCGRPILLDRPIRATGSDFDETIRDAAVPVLVDFYADWCAPCRMLAPVLDELASLRAGELLVLKVDSDGEPALAQRFGVRGLPTVLLFREGQERGRVVGLARRSEFDALLDSR